MSVRATGLIPMANTADMQSSIDFYARLGLAVCGSHKDPDGQVVWAHVKCEGAELMLTRASSTVQVARQGVVFYLYCHDLVALRNQLISQRVKVSEITYPLYMPKAKSA